MNTECVVGATCITDSKRAMAAGCCSVASLVVVVVGGSADGCQCAQRLDFCQSFRKSISKKNSFKELSIMVLHVAIVIVIVIKSRDKNK